MWLPASQHKFETKSFVDLIALDKILESIKPNYSCEIGVLHGDTLQVLDQYSKKTLAIDIIFSDKLNQRTFNNVEFLHAKDKNKRNDVFDFIHVDGDHSFQSCYDDLLYCIEHTTNESIILVDDYFDEKFKDVKNATDLFIEKSNFKISLSGHNQIFLQHKSATNILPDIIKSCFNKNLLKLCGFDIEFKTYKDISGQLDFQSKVKLLEHCL